MHYRTITLLCGILLGFTSAFLPIFEKISESPSQPESLATHQSGEMQLGAFSVSLTVKDLNKSKAFYEKLGFKMAGGNLEHNWAVMRNGTTTIGLFQGMFEKNIMTFNPGWNYEAKPIKEFTDVRELQSQLIEKGIKLTKPIDKANETNNKPASFVLQDPDGNMILVDQHVKKPQD